MGSPITLMSAMRLALRSSKSLLAERSTWASVGYMHRCGNHVRFLDHLCCAPDLNCFDTGLRPCANDAIDRHGADVLNDGIEDVPRAGR